MFCIMSTCGPLGLAGLSLLLHRVAELLKGKDAEVGAAPLAAWECIKPRNLYGEMHPHLP
jgi:hypothetical protein